MGVMTAQDETSRAAILTVDDDPGVSRAVARDLRRQYGARYRIVRAESASDALDALRQMKLRGDVVAVILADYRMPELNGIEFLEQAMDIYPGARRVLLTAYADTGAAIDAINVVDLDHYLLKPWDPPEEKLYPVVDALLDAWLESDHRPVPETKVVGHRWSARSSEVREFLARNQVPYRWYQSDEPEGAAAARRGRGGRAGAAGGDHPGRGSAGRADRRRAGRAGRAGHHAVEGLLRPDRDRRRPGRAGRGGVRGVRGAADGAGGAAGDRRAGGAELADRELPGLPGRGVRRAADRPGPAAGDQVRRRGADHPRRGRPGGLRLGAAGSRSRTAPPSTRIPSSWPPACPTGSWTRRGWPS